MRLSADNPGNNKLFCKHNYSRANSEPLRIHFINDVQEKLITGELIPKLNAWIPLHESTLWGGHGKEVD